MEADRKGLLLQMAAKHFMVLKSLVLWATSDGKFFRDEDKEVAASLYGKENLIQINRWEALPYIQDSLYF